MSTQPLDSLTESSSAPFFSRDHTAAAPGVSCFSILAEAEPGVMPRVLELFAKRGLVPHRWHSDVVGPAGQELAIDLQVHGLTPPLRDHIARCLRQIHYVERVLTSEKP